MRAEEQSKAVICGAPSLAARFSELQFEEIPINFLGFLSVQHIRAPEELQKVIDL